MVKTSVSWVLGISCMRINPEVSIFLTVKQGYYYICVFDCKDKERMQLRVEGIKH